MIKGLPGDAGRSRLKQQRTHARFRHLRMTSRSTCSSYSRSLSPDAEDLDGRNIQRKDLFRAYARP